MKITGASIGFSNPGDHAFGYALTTIVCGLVTCIENRFTCHPRPNGPHSSRCALSRPQVDSCCRAHSVARRSPGEPVSRGPITSQRWLSVSITFDRFKPSSRIFAMIGSIGCVVGAADGAVVGDDL